MKNFWKTVLAVIVASIIMSVVSSIFCFIVFAMITAIASSAGSSTTLPSEGVLRIDMSKMTIAEQSLEDNPFAGMSLINGVQSVSTVGLYDAVRALEAAAEDPGVKFIYMTPDQTSGGMAQIEEFRIALEKFRQCGKPIITYIENPGNGGYYLASVSDKIYMGAYNGGMNTLVGMSTQIVFLKDLLDKVGVNVQLIRHGKYKSAGEMYIKSEISPENRLQYETFIGSIWKNWSATMASARGISVEDFNALIDDLKLNAPKDVLEASLVDALYTKEELAEQLCTLYGVKNVKSIKQIPFAAYAKEKAATNYRAKDKIAIIYADGEIVDGKAPQQVAGDNFASIIAKVRRDSTVKAVVFRVNSPGGSVVASEKIQHEIALMMKDKPVIASYGNYAASGGYWISNGCDKIYSDASTLTGSIGVFSMIPDFSKTAKDLAHVNVVNISSNKHGDMYSMMRPLDNDELNYMQASVENIYDKFTSLVAEGRDLEKDYVDDIAQGRVWAGTDALEIKLVDEIGTLEDALAYAAQVARSDAGSEVSSYQVVAYPKPLTTMEQLAQMLNSSNSTEDIVFSGTPFESTVKAFRKVLESDPAIYARLPYDVVIK